MGFHVSPGDGTGRPRPRDDGEVDSEFTCGDPGCRRGVGAPTVRADVPISGVVTSFRRARLLSAAASGPYPTRTGVRVGGSSVAASVAIRMIGVPTGTVAPAETSNSSTTPAYGEGNSTSAFAVSTSPIT